MADREVELAEAVLREAQLRTASARTAFRKAQARLQDAMNAQANALLAVCEARQSEEAMAVEYDRARQYDRPPSERTYDAKDCSSGGRVVSTDPRTCHHTETEPVEVRNHETGGVEVVAHVCRRCLAQLPPEWGCKDCAWVETRRLQDPVPRKVLARPCERHA